MTDILTRLRELLDGPVPMSVERQDVRDAADEIEQLRKENELLLMKRPSSTIIDDIGADRDRWKKVAERLAQQLARDGLTDTWSIIERAGGTRG